MCINTNFRCLNCGTTESHYNPCLRPDICNTLINRPLRYPGCCDCEAAIGQYYGPRWNHWLLLSGTLMKCPFHPRILSPEYVSQLQTRPALPSYNGVYPPVFESSSEDEADAQDQNAAENQATAAASNSQIEHNENQPNSIISERGGDDHHESESPRNNIASQNIKMM